MKVAFFTFSLLHRPLSAQTTLSSVKHYFSLKKVDCFCVSCSEALLQLFNVSCASKGVVFIINEFVLCFLRIFYIFGPGIS